jgi:hypothetical protein
MKKISVRHELTLLVVRCHGEACLSMPGRTFEFLSFRNLNLFQLRAPGGKAGKFGSHVKQNNMRRSHSALALSLSFCRLPVLV